MADRFKFIEDLSILESVNLLSVGISTFNIKQQVPNDITLHNQFIPPDNLKSQGWLKNIEQWTSDQKIVLNEKKTKTLIFNYSENYKFTTRLTLNDEPIEVVNSTKLLGNIITDDLKWESNTQNLVKKS